MVDTGAGGRTSVVETPSREYRSDRTANGAAGTGTLRRSGAGGNH